MEESLCLEQKYTEAEVREKLGVGLDSAWKLDNVFYTIEDKLVVRWKKENK